MFKLRLWALLSLFFLPSLAFGAKFSNEYCEFELPMGWSCYLERSEWICQSESKDRQREAIIIIAAKTRAEKDSLDHYLNHLRSTKTFLLPGGKTQVSEPKYARPWSSTVDKHPWIDALHLASEVPGFFTRYMATIKEDLGIAVTFSVAKDHYDSYQEVFQSVIDSMIVFRRRDAKTIDMRTDKKDVYVTDIPRLETGKGEYDISVKQGSGTRGTTDEEESSWILYLLILAGLGFGAYKLKSSKSAAGATKKKEKKSEKKEDNPK